MEGSLTVISRSQCRVRGHCSLALFHIVCRVLSREQSDKVSISCDSVGVDMGNSRKKREEEGKRDVIRERFKLA